MFRSDNNRSNVSEVIFCNASATVPSRDAAGDADESYILLPQTKNGDGRIVWLNDSASAVIDSLHKGEPTDRLFPASLQVTPENL
jgi:hypothetical protein